MFPPGAELRVSSPATARACRFACSMVRNSAPHHPCGACCERLQHVRTYAGCGEYEKNDAPCYRADAGSRLPMNARRQPDRTAKPESCSLITPNETRLTISFA